MRWMLTASSCASRAGHRRPNVDGSNLTATIPGVATSITAFVGRALRGPIDEPVMLTSLAAFVEVFGGLSPEHPFGLAVQDFFRQGGTVAIAIRAHTPDSDTLDQPAFDRALDALRRAVPVNLIVVPGDLPPEAVAATTAFAEERRALFLRDPPSSWSTVDEAVADAASPAFPRSRNVAVYFPGISQPGPRRGPAGAVAGVIARNDVTHGVWKAPAGTEAILDGVSQLRLAPDDLASGRLNALGISCLRRFPGPGSVVWGARTTATDEWKYVAVRRTALFLEESIARGIRWAMFEPDDEPLRARICNEIAGFLAHLHRRGAFAGSTSREAYYVRCDPHETTGDGAGSGLLDITVGFAPRQPGEFVVLRLQQVTGQSVSAT